MTAWQRVVPVRPFDVLAGCFGVIAVAGIVLVLVSSLGGTGETESALSVVVVCAFLALVATFAWRLGRTGVYVSDRGVRVQYVVSSDVVDWADVHRFVVRRSRPGWIITAGSEEIWVVRRTGDPIETSLTHLTDRPLEDVLPWQRFAAVTRSRDEDFEQALSRLEGARIRYTGRGPV
ncbi:MAG: hypothetical protein GEV28_36905 [Actinophytocola sp.]|uniref:hypothetical protein n=1 Tax=Actinophytocola sp. TaxID=1872138 RepID=UPI00132AAA71|nr:hypothetical protein [Actinophytocola sp.]MPZ85664.1 hypothetical protein [Actinophytocola sp.]